MLTFCFVVYVEGFISFRQGNPSWNRFEKFKGFVNNLIKNIRYNKNGYKLVYDLVSKYRFPASFMLVGSLFKPLGNHDFIDWGSHTLTHLPLTLISDAQLEKEIKNTLNAKSITAPMWLVEDIKNPGRVFDAMDRRGYKITVYKGASKGSVNFHRYAVCKPFKKSNIICVHLSNVLEGNSSKAHIKKIKKEIISNLEKDAVYCLSTHDFTHRNTKNIENILNFALELQKQGLLKIKNIAEVADEFKAD